VSQTLVFRIRIDSGGAPIVRLLDRGRISVGAHPDNEIIVAHPGVSSRHAVFLVENGELWIEDLASKNGTYLDDLRIDRAPLRAGDRLRFGPVMAIVEEVDADDARLAVAAEEISSAASIQPRDQSTGSWTLAGGAAAQALAAVTELSEVLFQGVEGAESVALAILSGGLGGTGAWLVHGLRGGRHELLAGWGELQDPARHPDVRQFLETVASHGERYRIIASEVAPKAPVFAVAVAAAPGRRPLALGIENAAAPSEVIRSTLETALRMLVVRRLGSEHGLDAGLPKVDGDLVFPEGYVVGRSAASVRLHQQLRAVAASDLPLLIVGETGVGKEAVARTVHASSGRGSGPFVALNCAAIPPELLEAELFGIEEGVATGVAKRRGKLAAANAGTVFFDEVSDMPPVLQAKLLRALQEMEVVPVGAHAPCSIDVRLLAATNVDLRKALHEGTFRPDLYYRLAGATVRVCPLRERQEDIPQLIESLLSAHARAAGRRAPGITVRALRALVAAPWPGNVRQLSHELKRLLALVPLGAPIDSTMLSSEILSDPGAGEPGHRPTSPLDLPAQVENLERRLIAEALSSAGGNRSQAARILHLSRTGLLKKMKRYGIEN